MRYRYLGRSGLQVPALGFGCGTFGGQGPLFSAWGRSGVEHARRMIDICLDAGVNLFDTANVVVTAAAGAVGTKLAVTDKGGKPEKGVLVLEMTHGGVKQRKIVPVADPTITDEGAYVKGELRSYTVKVEALKDSAGAFSYEYTELDDAPA